MLETPARIEPCFFEEHMPTELADLSVDIQREATGLGQGLHPDSAAELADLVRVMNCYYSNLIEGHNTRPRDIERALAGAELGGRNPSLSPLRPGRTSSCNGPSTRCIARAPCPAPHPSNS
ncbi:hypothetical protein [Rhodophyticola sp.]|uniref:hypothetical protein n=1 Tax=Rhodophyticola sp. TaxID=2680032 RepID=UPI003D2A3527